MFALAKNPHHLRFACPHCGAKRITYRLLKAFIAARPRDYHGRMVPYEDSTESVGPLPCCGGALTPAQLKSLWGKATAARRETRTAGPGRPKDSARCPCGEMTLERAAKRRHKCVKKD